MSIDNANPFKRALEHIRNEPGLLRNVLVVSGLVFLAAIIGGYIFSQARANWPWEHEFRFAATFDQAPAISPGNGQEVRIAGVMVGEIRNATVNQKGQAELELAIRPQYKVYENARMVLRPKSPLNEMYIELSPGGLPAQPLEDGAVLPAGAAVRPVQIDEVLGDLDANTQAALTTLLSESDAALVNAPRELPGGIQATDTVLHRLQPLAERLQTRRELIARLMTALGTISSTVGNDDERLKELATSLQKTLQVTGERSDSVNAVLAQLPELTDRLREAMGGVQGLSDQLDPTLDNLKETSGTLPGALSRLTDTVDRAGEVVNRARPVLDSARPVVTDLRPLVADLKVALPDLHKSTGRLDELTNLSLPYLPDLHAFVYNTTSAYSFKDANGGILRGMQQYSPESVTGLLGLAKKRPELFIPPSGAGAAPAPVPVPVKVPDLSPRPSN